MPEPHAMADPARPLWARGVESGYGRVQILWGVDLHVEPGETVVLLGANGAGKTTLLKTLHGLLPAWRGEIRLEGRDVTRLGTSDRVRHGMVYMSELGVFPDLTIEENLRVGAQFLSRAAISRRAEMLYGIFPILAERRRALASSLSGGQRKMLGIAKSLAGDPRLLLMDEPSAGLSPLFVQEVIHVLAACRAEQHLALLIAEQNVKFLELADRVYTLEGGRIRFGGAVAELQANDELRRAYFGLK